MLTVTEDWEFRRSTGVLKAVHVIYLLPHLIETETIESLRIWVDVWVVTDLVQRQS
jgi:hypothetical protein